MAIFLLEDAGASITGDSFTLNGGIRIVHFQATNFGAGVKLEARADPSLDFVPLTYFGAPVLMLDPRSVKLEISPNGMEIRAVTTAGCAGVYVAILPSGTATD